MLLALADGLAFSFPITLVAYNVLQIFIGIDVFTAYNFGCIGNDIFRKTDLPGYFYGKRTSGITYLELEECLHQVAVVQHSSVHYTFMVFGKMLQILVVCSDNTER